MAKQHLVSLLFLGGLCLVATQILYECNCGVFLDIPIFPPRSLGPLNLYSAVDTTCNIDGWDNCTDQCQAQHTAWNRTNSLTDTIPGENVTWGNYFCGVVKHSMGGSYEQFDSMLELSGRIKFCRTYHDWDVMSYEPEIWVCCDTLGNYMTNC